LKKTLFVVGALAMAFVLWPVSSAHAGAESKCKACHYFTAKNKVGPGLLGVFGREAGSVEGYRYKFTKYIKGDPWVWDEENLKLWIDNSKKAIKKLTGNKKARTKMNAQHFKGEEADAVIAFLKELK